MLKISFPHLVVLFLAPSRGKKERNVTKTFACIGLHVARAGVFVEEVNIPTLLPMQGNVLHQNKLIQLISY
jgi:hypothetical protein